MAETVCGSVWTFIFEPWTLTKLGSKYGILSPIDLARFMNYDSNCLIWSPGVFDRTISSTLTTEKSEG